MPLPYVTDEQTLSAALWNDLVAEVNGTASPTSSPGDLVVGDASGKPTALPLVDQPVYNVKAFPFRARGNGGTDDLAAINAAISTCADAGGGTVWFPPGTYVVGIGATAKIVARSNVTLAGVEGASRIIVKADAGNYETMIGAATYGARVDRFTLRDLTIDQNPTGNTTSDIHQASTAESLFVLHLRNCSDVSVDNVHFDPYVGVNAVMINSDGFQSAGASVTNCDFRFQRGASTDPDYDTSAVYLAVPRAYVAGNDFYAPLSQRALGAIELHGPLSIATDNRIDGYQTGVHVVPEYAGYVKAGAIVGGPGTPSYGISAVEVTGNAMIRCCTGVSVIANPGTTVRMVDVSHNAIDIDQVAHDRQLFRGIYVVCGELAVGVKGLAVDHNQIRFRYEVAAGRAATTGGLSLGEGINAGIAVCPGAGQYVQGFSVAHNLIDGAPYMAILLGLPDGGTLRAGKVVDNVLVNPGQNAGTLTQDFRTAIYGYDVSYQGVVVEDNWQFDTGRSAGVPYGYRAISFIAISSANAPIVRRNGRWAAEGSIAGVPFDGDVQTDEGIATLDWPSIAAGATAVMTVTVKGVVAGDTITATPNGALEAGILKGAEYFAGADTVAIPLTNVSGVAVNPAARQWYVSIRKRQG